MISHGYDHFRSEHLKKIYGWSEDDPIQIELRKLHGYIIERIMNGDLPDEIRPLYADTEAFAAPKSDTDIRPLGKINLDRKLAGAMLLKMYRTDITEVFGDVQYAVDPKGTEKIVHSIHAGLESHPDYDFFAPDASNAFNRCNREIGLFEYPPCLPLRSSFTVLSRRHGFTEWKTAFKISIARKDLNKAVILEISFVVWRFCRSFLGYLMSSDRGIHQHLSPSFS